MKKILTLLSLLFLFACGSNNKESKSDKKEQNQELNIFLKSEPKTLDISRGSDLYSSEVIALTNEGLVTAKINEKGEEIITPGVAESWSVSPDNLTWTFKLRDNSIWADGKPVTAQNFQYGITRTLNPSVGSSYAFLLYPIKGAKAFNSGKGSIEDVGVKAINDKTLEITLKSPTPYFLQLGYFKVMFPQRKDIIDKYGEAYGSEGNHILSNGPYNLTEWVHSNKVVLEKNPTYWNSKEYKLDKINMLIVADENSRMNLLASKQVDMGYTDKPEWIKQFMSTGNFLNNRKYSLSTNYIAFNTTNKYFKNEKIRKAFSLAINRDEINKVMFNGNFEPAYGFVTKGLSIGDKEYRSIVPEPLRKLKEENPDPKALLSQGLIELGMDPNPKNMTITYLSSGTDTWFRKYSELLQQMLQQNLGVNIKAEFVEWPVYQKRVDELDYEMGGQGWSADYNDPNTFLDLWTTTAKIVPTGWSNKKYDTLIEKASLSSNEEERTKYFKQAENILLYEDSVIAPVLYKVKNTYYRNYIKNYKPTTVAPYTYKEVFIEGRE